MSAAYNVRITVLTFHNFKSEILRRSCVIALENFLYSIQLINIKLVQNVQQLCHCHFTTYSYGEELLAFRHETEEPHIFVCP